MIRKIKKQKFPKIGARILIIGHPGAGKSTLAAELGPILNLPVVYLDREFWKPGWVMPESSQWLDDLARLLAEPKWIMDGNFGISLPLRLQKADTCIFLDFSRYSSLWGVFKRILIQRGEVRADNADYCPERWNWSFLKWVWNFRKNTRPPVLKALKERPAEVSDIRLCNREEVSRFIDYCRDG